MALVAAHLNAGVIVVVTVLNTVSLNIIFQGAHLVELVQTSLTG